MKTTPGPWRPSGHEVKGALQCGKRPTVAVCLTAEDARLIAAAPDLLKAAKAVQDNSLPVSCTPSGYREALKRKNAAWKSLRAAIAKAEVAS